jgi:metal-dependent amidase/aminoacylase/carboxypeptidase family protein
LHGFQVTKHYLDMNTAWRAEFSHKTGGRILGVNSEMDALPKIGHAYASLLDAIAPELIDDLIGAAITLSP